MEWENKRLVGDEVKEKKDNSQILRDFSPGRGYMYNYRLFVLYSRNQHNVVKQLSSNWKKKN